MYPLLTVIAVAFLLVLAAVVANAALIINCKIEVQNGADSIAYSSSLAVARAMNAITATNHLIGELQALVVLHHAIGGDELDGEKSSSPSADDAERIADLATWFTAAEIASPVPGPSADVFRETSKMPDGGATLHDSVARLQTVLTWTYEAFVAAGAAEKAAAVPVVGEFVAAGGYIMALAAKTFETKVKIERAILKRLEQLAKALKPVKKAIELAIAALHNGYARLVVWETGSIVSSIVRDEARANAVDGTLFPKPRPLLFAPPVHTEPRDLSSMRKSQLVRASFPWINHWRAPILDLMDELLRLSRAAHYYKHYTNLFTLKKAREAKQRRAVNLYVLRELDLAKGDKGNEVWTRRSGSPVADRLFCVVGFAHRKSPPRAGGGFFSPQNPDGIVAYAQGMIYNANPQAGGGGRLQPRVGWDTLNWASDVLEHQMNEGKTSDEPSDQPQIRVNWQAKLVPVTRLTQSASEIDDPFRAVIRRSTPDRYSFKTH